MHLLGLLVHQQGNHHDAIALVKQAIAINPANPGYHNTCGEICRKLQDYEAAINYYRAALRNNSKYAIAHSNLGDVLHMTNRFGEAEKHYLLALEIEPRLSIAHYNLGGMLSATGRLEEALKHYHQAVEQQPDSIDARLKLVNTLQAMGQTDAAIRQYEKVLTLRPGDLRAHNNLGLLLHQRGQIRDAEKHFREALRLNPGLAEVHANLGNIYHGAREFDKAESHYRKALALNPSLLDVQLNLGGLLQEKGKLEKAKELYKQVIQQTPGNVTARWMLCMAQIPEVYHHENEYHTSREQYRHALNDLNRSIDLTNKKAIDAAARAVGISQPFSLAYQGKDDRELQRLYGELVCRIQAARYPQWSNPPKSAEIIAGRKMRVGIVSGYFCEHSNWKIPIKGWIENIDRHRFSLFGYYTRSIVDKRTREARQVLPNLFMHSSFEGLCRRISNDRLDVLIYPEIGMDPMTLRLAGLRLAPVQCTSWGHPETSGLPTIDYYLSSELMEAEGNERFYTEQLVCLPNLSIYYTPLEDIASDKGREDFGLRENSVAYFCAQSLRKYLPQYDEVFPLIAKDAGDCQFVFLSKDKNLTNIFKNRLRKVFDRHNLEMDNYISILPSMNPADFQALSKICDIFLDSIGWSGCNTTLEAIGHNLPIVTLPRELMRSRHTMAILSMMGISEAITGNVEEYIQLAVALCQDEKHRKAASKNIATNKHLIYKDSTCIRGLEDFLLTAKEY